MLCKDCGKNSAKPKYNGLCSQCRTRRYAYSQGKTCPDCGMPVTNKVTKCFLCKQKERRNRKKCACEWCGKVFETKPSEAGRFCSASCRGSYTASIVNPDRHRKEHICEYCGKVFTSKRASEQPHYFCSKKCYGRWLETQGNHPRAVIKPVLTCPICGKQFTRKPSEADYSIYCSRRCHGRALSALMAGNSNPNWKGGHTPYRGPNWSTQKWLALKWASDQCEYCHKTTKENGRSLSVHHITPFREFGYIPGVNENYRQANDLSNLAVLCNKCHGLAEHGKIKVLPKFH